MNLSYLLFLVSASALDPKPCITCKHFINVKNIQYSRCKMFPVLNMKDELVNGYSHYALNDYYYSSTARTFGSMCGENGKHYEKIELFEEENMVTYTKRPY
jgi:hypothetical protein